MPSAPVSSFSSSIKRIPASKDSGRARSRYRTAALLLAITAGLYLLSARHRDDVPTLPKLARAIKPQRAEPVHKVERAVLESLRLLEIEMNGGKEVDEEEARYRGGHAYEASRPPAVGFIPEMANKKNGILIPAHDIDRRVCGGPCQFLVPAWIGEQETKAQAHLYQLGLLAVALNRTLVLPNVMKSRLGACYPNPFTYYYAADSLSRLGISTIMHTDFLAWAATRDPPPTAQVISMLGTKAEHPRGAVAYDAEGDPSLVPTKPDRKLCLSPPRAWLDFTPYSPLSLFPPEAWHKQKSTQFDYGRRVFGTLLSSEIANKTTRASEATLPTVLAFNYEIRYPIFDIQHVRDLMIEAQTPDSGFASDADEGWLVDEVQAATRKVKDFEHFPYATTWTKQAADVAASLSPYIAIHWRQETLPTSVLSTCAAQLVKTLEDISAEYPDIRTVYLATDYPLNGKAHSGTFSKLITEDHHRAMRHLVQNLPAGLRLTSYAQEAEEDVDGLDSGLLGIIDKNIAMQADVFLTGFPGDFQYDPTACGKESSFTRQIIQARKARAEKKPGRQILDTFDVNGRRRH